MSKIKKKYPDIIEKVKKNASIVILITVLSILLIGTVVVSLLSKQTQEIRQRASIDQGIVVITPQQGTVQIGQPSSIDFSVNTNSVQIDGIQLYFTVDSTVGSAFDFETTAGSGLQVIAKNIQDIGNGSYTVEVIVIGPVTQPISSSSDFDFGRLVFTPTQAGSITLTFDPVDSIATVYRSQPVQDQLRNIPNFSLQVQATATATPTPTPTPTPTSQTQATPTPTPTSTPNQGTGGQSIKQCNESCISNADCAANLTCHFNVCRLATNPSSSSCQGAPDQGIHRSCNEYCADNNECQSGLTCYFNRCRNPQNVSNTSCQQPTPTPKTTVGGTAKTPTPTPKTTVGSTPTPISVAQNTSPQPSPTVTSVFGNGQGQNQATPISTSDNTASLRSPLPTLDPDKKTDEESLANLPQILLIAAIISLPILFFAPLLLSRLSKGRSRSVASSDLEHNISSQSHSGKPGTPSDDMKGFAGVSMPTIKTDESSNSKK